MYVSLQSRASQLPQLARRELWIRGTDSLRAAVRERTSNPVGYTVWTPHYSRPPAPTALNIQHSQARQLLSRTRRLEESPHNQLADDTNSPFGGQTPVCRTHYAGWFHCRTPRRLQFWSPQIVVRWLETNRQINCDFVLYIVRSCQLELLTETDCQKLPDFVCLSFMQVPLPQTRK